MGDDRNPGVRRGDPPSPLFLGDLATGGGKYGERRAAERERKSVGPGPSSTFHELAVYYCSIVY